MRLLILKELRPRLEMGTSRGKKILGGSVDHLVRRIWVMVGWLTLIGKKSALQYNIYGILDLFVVGIRKTKYF